MTTYSICQLMLDIIDPYSQRKTYSNNLKLANARRSISREILVPANASLYDLHLYTQKLFGWRDFYTHKFSLCDEDFIRVTKGNREVYDHLCGILFRSEQSCSFDWYWHELKDDPLLTKCNVIMESSFLNEKRRLNNNFSHNSPNTWLECLFPKSHQNGKNTDLNTEANCLIERLTLGEIFKPSSGIMNTMYSQDNVEEWKQKLHKNSVSCINRLHTLSVNYPNEFYEECDALEELDGWKESFKKLQRIRMNPAAVESRFGQDYSGALKHHLEMFLDCYEHARNIVENYNPKLEPFFTELMYKYDRGENWQVRIRCLNVFELSEKALMVAERSQNMSTNYMEKDYSDSAGTKSANLVAEVVNPYAMYNVSQDLSSLQPSLRKPTSSWLDGHGRLVPRKISILLDKVENTHSPICYHADGLSVMDDIGGISGFFEFLRTLNGHDKTAARRVREMAEIYGWSEKNDPTNIKL